VLYIVSRPVGIDVLARIIITSQNVYFFIRIVSIQL
jgi:hypothetical protein